jgi:subtilisin family serine protease
MKLKKRCSRLLRSFSAKRSAEATRSASHTQLGLSTELLEVRAVLSGGPLANGAVGDDADATEQSYLVMSRGETFDRGFEDRVAQAGGTIGWKTEFGVAQVTSSSPTFAGDLSRRADVSVARDVTVDRIGGPANYVMLGEAETDDKLASDDDFLAVLQWNLDAVNAPEAWAQGARGQGVRVAVLDTGISPHPDLLPNLNLDLGKSFIEGEGLIFDPTIPGSFDHATHVAGIIAAADNAYGVIGVAPEAEIVPVKVLGDNGYGPDSGVIAGIVYAADIGADVINLSLGSTLTRRGGEYEGELITAREAADIVTMFIRATTYAHHKGAVVIASAGNDTIDLNHAADFVVLPAQMPHVIAVSATSPLRWGLDQETDLDIPAFYTNYGKSVIDVAAPGGSVDFDLIDSNESCTVGGFTRPCWVFDLVLSSYQDNWLWTAGTSMAAPHASGVAALIIGQNDGQRHPDQVRAILKRTADDLGKPGQDDFYGQGRVNAEVAASRATNMIKRGGAGSRSDDLIDAFHARTARR